MGFSKIFQIYGIRASRYTLYKWILENPTHPWYTIFIGSANSYGIDISKYMKQLLLSDKTGEISDDYQDFHNDVMTCLENIWHGMPNCWNTEGTIPIKIIALPHDQLKDLKCVDEVMIGIVINVINIGSVCLSVDPLSKLPISIYMDDYDKFLKTVPFLNEYDSFKTFLVQDACYCCS